MAAEESLKTWSERNLISQELEGKPPQIYHFKNFILGGTSHDVSMHGAGNTASVLLFLPW